MGQPGRKRGNQAGNGDSNAGSGAGGPEGKPATPETGRRQAAAGRRMQRRQDDAGWGALGARSTFAGINGELDHRMTSVWVQPIGTPAMQ